MDTRDVPTLASPEGDASSVGIICDKVCTVYSGKLYGYEIGTEMEHELGISWWRRGPNLTIEVGPKTVSPGPTFTRSGNRCTGTLFCHEDLGRLGVTSTLSLFGHSADCGTRAPATTSRPGD